MLVVEILDSKSRERLDSGCALSVNESSVAAHASIIMRDSVGTSALQIIHDASRFGAPAIWNKVERLKTVEHCQELTCSRRVDEARAVLQGGWRLNCTSDLISHLLIHICLTSGSFRNSFLTCSQRFLYLDFQKVGHIP